MWLIKASLRNPYMVATIVFMIIVLGAISLCADSRRYPARLQGAGRPGHHLLPGHAGLLASKRPSPTASSAGSTRRPGASLVESKSIPGVSIVRVYFRDDIDPTAALTMTNQLALGTLPTLAAQHAAAGRAAVRSDGTMPLGVLTVENPYLGRSQRQGRGPHRGPQHARRGDRAASPRWSSAARTAPSSSISIPRSWRPATCRCSTW